MNQVSPKKGNFSTGAGRHYCGNIGKVDNSQVGVFAAYASSKGYALVDRELYIPEKWFDDAYAQKREKCRFPEELEFKTKPELATEMFRKIKEEATLPFRYVTADSICGENPTFISAIEECHDVVYFVSMGSDTSFWLQQPKTIQKEYKHKGEIKIKEVVPKTEKKAITAKEIATGLHNTFWYRKKVSEGTKGPIEYEFTKRRVVLSNEGLPRKTVWLVIKRTITDEPTYSLHLSNAPINSRQPLFVWLSGLR
jgi:SRSO17 transposase